MPVFLPAFLPAFLPLLFLTGCAVVSVSLLPRPEPLTEHLVEGTAGPKILLLDISGIISETGEKKPIGGSEESIVARTRETLALAGKDPGIRGMILRINTPGGSVTASDILHHEIRAFREKSRMPVMAAITSVGASGGYYVASAADRIYAHPTSITGSIGVIAVQMNVSGLLTKIGIEDKVVKSGEKKDIFSYLREDSPEERKIIQEIVDRFHGRFVDVVTEGRSGRISRDDVVRLADGRPYTAGQALDAGLIDGIAYLGDVVTEMKKRMGVEEARVIVFAPSGIRPGSLYGSIEGPASTPSARDPLAVLSALGERAAGSALPDTHFLYLWAP